MATLRRIQMMLHGYASDEAVAAITPLHWLLMVDIGERWFTPLQRKRCHTPHEMLRLILPRLRRDITVFAATLIQAAGVGC